MKKFIYLIICLCVTLSSCEKKDGVTLVDLKDFLEEGTIDGDHTLAFRNALEYCKEVKASKLVVPAGDYSLYPDYAFEKYQYVSNNTAALKRILLDVSKMENFEIDGTGANLLFHGYMVPFNVDSCKNVKITGFSVDYARAFHSEGIIKKAGEGWADLSFPKEYIYKIINGDLHFFDERGEVYPVSHLLEWNSERLEPELQTAKHFVLTKKTKNAF